ncbi:MAG TPA: DUF1579 family protein [Terriglobales bacterium]|jgi:hypothetical protein|nr:DUF1579 family protein [Terriglobales bacterium]
MRWTITLGIVVFLGLTVVVSAQMPMPTPAPEVKNFDFFNGKWTMEGDMKPGPMGPGGKFGGNETCEWMEGNFFLVCHNTFESQAMGNGKGLAVMGYDSDKKVYVYNAFNSMGESERAEGTLSGDTWTWNSESSMAGQPIKTRFVIKQTSPTSYDFKMEMAAAGAEMKTAMEGKATKH